MDNAFATALCSSFSLTAGRLVLGRSAAVELIYGQAHSFLGFSFVSLPVNQGYRLVGHDQNRMGIASIKREGAEGGISGALGMARGSSVLSGRNDG